MEHFCWVELRHLDTLLSLHRLCPTLGSTTPSNARIRCVPLTWVDGDRDGRIQNDADVSKTEGREKLEGRQRDRDWCGFSAEGAKGGEHRHPFGANS